MIATMSEIMFKIISGLTPEVRTKAKPLFYKISQQVFYSQ